MTMRDVSHTVDDTLEHIWYRGGESAEDQD